MKISDVQRGDGGAQFRSTVERTMAHPNFASINCYTVITVIPLVDGTDSEVSIESVGSEADQNGMLIALIRHAADSVIARKRHMAERNEPDILDRAGNTEQLESMVKELVARMKTA